MKWNTETKCQQSSPLSSFLRSLRLQSRSYRNSHTNLRVYLGITGVTGRSRAQFLSLITFSFKDYCGIFRFCRHLMVESIDNEMSCGRLNASWKISSSAVDGQSFLVIDGSLLSSHVNPKISYERILGSWA